METKPILDALERLYVQEGHRIVFWHDPDREFSELMSGRMLPLEIGEYQIPVVDLSLPHSDLALKMRLEREDPMERFLLYAPFEEPDVEKDWLLDIRLYSKNFRADRASIHLQDLGLVRLDLHDHVQQRAKFFDAKERVEKLRKIVDPGDGAAELDRKMMAVVLKAEQPELFVLLRTVYHAYLDVPDGETPDLESPPAVWKELVKFELAAPFWEMVAGLFGYQEEHPNLQNLLIRLLVSDFGHSLKGKLPGALAHLNLSRDKVPNAVTCLAQWRDSSRHAESYDLLSGLVQDKVKVAQLLDGFEVEDLSEGMTFQILEKIIASRLRDRVLLVQNPEHVQAVRAITGRRQAGHWATPQVGSTQEVPREGWNALYEALGAAAELFELRVRFDASGFPNASPEALYGAYERELYRFDQLYRQFHEGAEKVREWNILKDLQKQVENVYTQGFLQPLALAWGQWLGAKADPNLLDRWRIEGVPAQSSFYAYHVAPKVEDRRRVFVIISDAFRYEAAQELTKELNGKYRIKADLSSCLGVLPSITSLGMASLLPHQSLGLTKDGNPMVDGLPAGSLEQRNEVLRRHGGIACKADELLAKKREDGRAFVEPHQMVYIYHDLVDATGDKASSESQAFQAVRKTIDVLAKLVSHIVNSLNGYHVLITADHGFLFTEAPPGETEKTKLESDLPGAFPNKSKKRYVMGLKLPKREDALHGKVSNTARFEGDAEFLVPRGIQRFHFVGGARFVHGGAMLQEIVVPVVTVRHKKGPASKGTETKTVQVQVLGTHHKITAAKHRFELIQTEPVGERVKPVTLKIAIYEGDSEAPVSDVQALAFDSTSESLDQRRKWVLLTLREGAYNRQTSYRLVLRDAETSLEHQSIPVTIDRAFDDF